MINIAGGIILAVCILATLKGLVEWFDAGATIRAIRRRQRYEARVLRDLSHLERYRSDIHG